MVLTVMTRSLADVCTQPGQWRLDLSQKFLEFNISNHFSYAGCTCTLLSGAECKKPTLLSSCYLTCVCHFWVCLYVCHVTEIEPVFNKKHQFHAEFFVAVMWQTVVDALDKKWPSSILMLTRRKISR